MHADLPLVIAGPILRHIAFDTFTVWLVTREPLTFNMQISKQHESDNLITPESQENLHHTCIAVGKYCYIHTLVVNQDPLFSDHQWYQYNAQLITADKQKHLLSDLCKDMLYASQNGFGFRFRRQLSRVLHGSCRKPHFKGADALPQLDSILYEHFETRDETSNTSSEKAELRPDLVVFSGDQVYIDDVAGPMLQAIAQVIDLLELFPETFEGSTIKHSNELKDHADGFYRREQLLPHTKANEELAESFFQGKRKPIFTSVNAHNHLIALNEMLALYLLSWSSRLWPLISFDKPDLAEEFSKRYQQEQCAIEDFVVGLKPVERSFAHVPIYMIFDDHDVTDDWNLSRAWEDQVYHHPFSKRIIGNALVAYLLCQGLGNPKTTWQQLSDDIKNSFADGEIKHHDELIDAVLNHHHWHYRLNTSPPIQVLDTRTQRWRSENNANKPSGLMDWEALCELQQQIIGQESVIMVSAAPIYGVKFIEAIQRVFITFGGALMVDAENWMAHRGTANVILNIFRHIKTPPSFIILSGDVHYSFVYDVSLRFRRNSPKIVQFTCSGIHNQFPDKLIKWFERLNRFFYGHRSPLNWLTKRRNMSIREREVEHAKRDIVNHCALGVLDLCNDGKEQSCRLILADGSVLNFSKDK